MSVQGAQQMVQADRGGVIHNVTQIIQSDRPDVVFSRGSAQRIPNRTSQQNAVAIARDKLQRYFWKPPGLGDALLSCHVQGWSVPLWRLHGEVSATWTKFTREVIKETEQEKLEQIVPSQNGIAQRVDWLVPAYREKDNASRALSEAIYALDCSELPVRIDWQGYPLGEFLEHLWPNLQLRIGDWPLRRHSALANADMLFGTQASNSVHEIEETKPVTWLPELEPEITLQEAVERADRKMKDHVQDLASESDGKIADFGLVLDVDTAEQYWFPFWVVLYSLNNAQCSAVLNGFANTVINALLPRSFRAGFIAWSIPTLTFGLPLWALALYFFYSAFSSHQAGSGLAISLCTPVLFTLAPLIMTGMLVVAWWVRHQWLSR